MSSTERNYVLVGQVRTTTGNLVGLCAENSETADAAYFLDDTGEVCVIDGLGPSCIKPVVTDREKEQLMEFYKDLEESKDGVVGIVMKEQGYLVLTDIVVGGGYYCADGSDMQEVEDLCIVSEDFEDIDDELADLLEIVY